MVYLAWGAALLLIFLLVSRWLAETSTQNVKRLLYVLVAVLLLGVGLFLVATGKAFAALPALGAAWAFYNRYRRAKWFWETAQRWAGRAQGGGAAAREDGSASGVDTGWLEMRLDHATGEVDGRVKQGAYAGRLLSDLGENDLARLRGEILGADRDALRLLDAYLERRFGADWQARFSTGEEESAAKTDDKMTQREALEILGQKEGAGPEDIRHAHHKLMQKIHPDHGGSSYLAAKINEAKALLLKK